MVLQLQGCVTEKKQTVMEFTLRTLKEIPWTDLTSYFKILHPTDFSRTRRPLGLKDESTTILRHALTCEYLPVDTT